MLLEPVQFGGREDGAVDEGGAGRDNGEVVVEVDDAASGEADRADLAVDAVVGQCPL
ncbi:hypothetical protein [Streptomyces sp. NPDC059247]|uniref:hypothetical protein n=1 Tax=Streptomyces sp. NPDC059247 TaxID=3346790 RepID=UPI00369504DD